MMRFRDPQTGQKRDLTAEEEAAHVATAFPTLEEVRKARIDAIREEATARIDALMGADDTIDALSKRLDQLTTALILLRRELKGTATAPQIAQLDALQVLASSAQSTRAAARTAITSIKAASDITAVNAVTVVWP